MNMKIKILCFLLTITTYGFSQTDTDIYLFDFIQGDSIIVIDNPINISDNKGYDNQPSFLNDGSGVLYASTRDEQTDIALYDIENNINGFLVDTEEEFLEGMRIEKVWNKYSIRQSVTEKFSSETILKRYEALCTKIIND